LKNFADAACYEKLLSVVRIQMWFDNVFRACEKVSCVTSKA